MIEGDFTNPKMFDKLEKDYDFIYMLASVVGVNRCIEEPHEFSESTHCLFKIH